MRWHILAWLRRQLFFAGVHGLAGFASKLQGGCHIRSIRLLLLHVPRLAGRCGLMWGAPDSMHVERRPSVADFIIAALGIRGGHRPLDAIWQEMIDPGHFRGVFPVLIDPN